MLAADAAPRVRVLLAGRTLVTLVQALVVLAALGLLWRSRPALRARGSGRSGRGGGTPPPRRRPASVRRAEGDGALC